MFFLLYVDSLFKVVVSLDAIERWFSFCKQYVYSYNECIRV